jgi:hypothetical protein
VYPGGHEYLYQDQIGARWEAAVSSAGTLDLAGSDVVHGGSYAQAITLPSGYLRYTCADPDGFSTFGYSILEFWIHPGTSATEQVTLGLNSVAEGSQYRKLGYDLGITLAPNEWQLVSIPLEDLGVADTRLKYMQVTGVVGTIYMDDLVFAAPEYQLRDAAAHPQRLKADVTMSTLLTVQAAPAVAQPGGPPTVTVDLSPLGGAQDAVMTDDGTWGDHVAGDGIYTLQTTVDPQVENARKKLVITSTDRHLRVVRTHLFVEVFPYEERIIYEDEPGEGWTVQVRRGASDLMSSTFVHSGSFSHAISPNSRTGMNVEYTLDDPEGISPFGYTLEFYINGGEASGQDPSIAGRNLSQLGIVLQANTWTLVSFALSELTPGDRLRGIPFSGTPMETFYIDDMKLVAVQVEIPTAVEEASQETAGPLGYALAQNYPNPFNAATAIRFDMDRAEEIDLTLYNLTGQKVVSLARGHREAGTYSLRWDGRDDSGRELATGVYLYRLTAGDRVETRKLLLLR